MIQKLKENKWKKLYLDLDNNWNNKTNIKSYCGDYSANNNRMEGKKQKNDNGKHAPVNIMY